MMHSPIPSFSGIFRWLSNLYICEVNLDNTIYRSVEHAFQAAKSVNHMERMRMATIEHPVEAKRMGGPKGFITLRPDWSDKRYSIMEDLVYDKFTRNAQLGAMLVATGHRELIEGNYWNDTFWGVCRNRGENNLGYILMSTRAKLRGETE
jgi:ribA/ribD-fused uncharacterized protein